MSRNRTEYNLIQLPSDLKRMVEVYRERSLPVSFDTETTGFDPLNGKMITLQFKQFGASRATIVDVRDWPSKNAFKAGVGEILAPLFDGSLLVVGVNLKFDYKWMLTHFGIRMSRMYDIMLAEQVIYGLGVSEGKSKGIAFNLKSIAERRGIDDVSKEERSWFVGLDKRTDEWDAALPDNQLLYAAQDVDVLERIMRQQHSDLERLDLVRTAKIEFDCIGPLAEMELNGTTIDETQWRQIIKEKEEEALQLKDRAIEVFGPAILTKRAEKVDAEMAEYNRWERARDEMESYLREQWEEKKNALGKDIAGKWGDVKSGEMKIWRSQNPRPDKPKANKNEINVSSPAQLKSAFEVTGIDLPSTELSVLEENVGKYPQLKPIVELRRAEKIVNSFGESLLKFGVPLMENDIYYDEEGNEHHLLGIHPDYVQIGASTGRMSCSKPNWQQIPSRSDTGKRLRGCVVSRPGFKLLTADFKNIELYTLANISQCPVMCGFFEQGRDLHTETARAMFDLDESVDVENEQAPGMECSYRAAGKTTNFLIVYGGGPGTLSQRLHVDKEKSNRFIAAFFDLYPGVAQWRKETTERVLNQLKSRTLSGRIRFFELPDEPQFPFRNRSTEAIREYYEQKREWNMKRSEVSREGCNAEIQGTSADITKVALSEFFSRTIPLNAKMDNTIRLTAVVHDEIVVETKDEYAVMIGNVLADSMQHATDMFLTRVRVPRSKVTISDHWSK